MNRRLLPVLAGGVGIAGAVLVALFVDGHTFDFGLDWLTARALLLGVDPYQSLGQLGEQFGVVIDGGGHWIHPRTPAALLVQAPIGLIPQVWVYDIGRLLTIGSFVAMAWVVARLARVPVHWCLAAMPVLLFVRPFSDVLVVSQTSALVAAGIGLTWVMLRDRDRVSAGFPLAVAISLKLWPWLLVPGLWWTGHRKAAVGCAAGFGALNLAGLALPHVTLSGVVAGLVGADDLGSPTLIGGIPIWAPALLAAGVVFVVRRRSEWLVYSVAITAGLVASPVLWPHYLVALTIPVALFVGARRESGRDESGRLADTASEASPTRLPLTRS